MSVAYGSANAGIDPIAGPADRKTNADSAYIHNSCRQSNRTTRPYSRVDGARKRGRRAFLGVVADWNSCSIRSGWWHLGVSSPESLGPAFSYGKIHYPPKEILKNPKSTRFGWFFR